MSLFPLSAETTNRTKNTKKREAASPAFYISLQAGPKNFRLNTYMARQNRRKRKLDYQHFKRYNNVIKK